MAVRKALKPVIALFSFSVIQNDPPPSAENNFVVARGELFLLSRFGGSGALTLASPLLVGDGGGEQNPITAETKAAIFSVERDRTRKGGPLAAVWLELQASELLCCGG